MIYLSTIVIDEFVKCMPRAIPFEILSWGGGIETKNKYVGGGVREKKWRKKKKICRQGAAKKIKNRPTCIQHVHGL